MKNKGGDRIYLSSYILHKDNRIRLPKAIENNLTAIPGETYFDIYYDVASKEIVLKKSNKTASTNK